MMGQSNWLAVGKKKKKKEGEGQILGNWGFWEVLLLLTDHVVERCVDTIACKVPDLRNI
jgi:hypothetical protein